MLAIPTDDQWQATLGDIQRWLNEKRVRFAHPVAVSKEGEIDISEYAMIPEKPYLVQVGDECFEFVRKADGSIVMSELCFP